MTVKKVECQDMKNHLHRITFLWGGWAGCWGVKVICGEIFLSQMWAKFLLCKENVRTQQISLPIIALDLHFFSRFIFSFFWQFSFLQAFGHKQQQQRMVICSFLLLVFCPTYCTGEMPFDSITRLWFYFFNDFLLPQPVGRVELRRLLFCFGKLCGI